MSHAAVFVAASEAEHRSEHTDLLRCARCLACPCPPAYSRAHRLAVSENYTRARELSPAYQTFSHEQIPTPLNQAVAIIVSMLC